MIFITGLVLIAIGWLVQLKYILKDKKEIQPLFVGMYMVGVLLLIISDYTAGDTTYAIFESGTFIASAIVLVKLLKK